MSMPPAGSSSDVITPEQDPSQHCVSVRDVPWAHRTVTLLNGHITLDPGVQCFLYEECLSLLTKQVDLNETAVPLTQKASIFLGKEHKIANALKIYILVAHRQLLAIFGLSYVHFHCFGLSSCYHSNFPVYIREK